MGASRADQEKRYPTRTEDDIRAIMGGDARRTASDDQPAPTFLQRLRQGLPRLVGKRTTPEMKLLQPPGPAVAGGNPEWPPDEDAPRADKARHLEEAVRAVDLARELLEAEVVHLRTRWAELERENRRLQLTGDQLTEKLDGLVQEFRQRRAALEAGTGLKVTGEVTAGGGGMDSVPAERLSSPSPEKETKGGGGKRDGKRRSPLRRTKCRRRPSRRKRQLPMGNH